MNPRFNMAENQRHWKQTTTGRKNIPIVEAKKTKKSKAGFKFDGLNDQQLQSLLTQLLQEREKANG